MSASACFAFEVWSWRCLGGRRTVGPAVPEVDQFTICDHDVLADMSVSRWCHAEAVLHFAVFAGRNEQVVQTVGRRDISQALPPAVRSGNRATAYIELVREVFDKTTRCRWIAAVFPKIEVENSAVAIQRIFGSCSVKLAGAALDGTAIWS